jgi:NitT/TauT family transport system permease protein
MAELPIDTGVGRARRGTGKLSAHPLTLLVGRILVISTILAVWQAASGNLIKPIWVSSPSRIFLQLQEWTLDGTLWQHLQATLVTMVLGYAGGALIGLLAGFLLGVSPRVEQVLSPFMAAIWCLPKIALLPLFIIFLGIGIASKVALVALVVVFLVLYSTIDGVRDVDPDLVRLLQLMGAKRREILLKVILPSAVPWIYTGLRIAVSYALVTTVVCELLMSNLGLGFLIESSAAGYNAAGVFAAVTVLVVLSVTVTESLAYAEAYFLRWRN